MGNYKSLRPWDKIIIKQTSVTLTTDTTPNTDAELKANLAVGTWEIELKIYVNSHATPAFKATCTFGGTATGNWGPDTVVAPQIVSIPLATNLAIATDQTPEILVIHALAIVSAQGEFAFAWSQNVSDANDTIVLKGSTLKIKKVI